MNPARCTGTDSIAVLVATPRAVSGAEAARIQPLRPQAPAHDAFTRLLRRREPDPAMLWHKVALRDPTHAWKSAPFHHSSAGRGAVLSGAMPCIMRRAEMGEPHPPHHWSEDIHALFRAHEITFVLFVPDGGHKLLIERCKHDPAIHAIPLTTEEEGIAFAAGVFLGGKRSALLMQSSGVGNCVNMLSLPSVCNMPLLLLVTMRGEWGEFNPWQIPMGQSTPAVLAASDVIVYRVDVEADVRPTVEAAIGLAFASRRRVAVLLSQRLIGAKQFDTGAK